MELQPIAHIQSDYKEKFGIPRQGGLVPLAAQVVFTDAFQNADMLRGLSEYSHLWMIWGFSETIDRGWKPTVRPPRLGGNKRLGVFATRAPNRPNALGLTAAKILEINRNPMRVVVQGADMLDGTPIYDIKPYLPYADAIADAKAGFAHAAPQETLQVCAEGVELAKLPPEKQAALLQVLALDPRPGYQDDPTRIYGMQFAGFDVRFTVAGEKLSLISIS